MKKFTSYSPCCEAPVLANTDTRGQFRHLYCHNCGKVLADFRTKARFIGLVNSLKWERHHGHLFLRCMGAIVASATPQRWFVEGHPLSDVLNLHQCSLADCKSQRQAEASLRRHVKASFAQIIETIPSRRPSYERILKKKGRS